MSVRTASATVEIAAPIARVWAVMLDFPRYGEWNPFVFRVDGASSTPALGDRFVLRVRWADGGEVSSPDKIVQLDSPQEGASATSGKATLAYAACGGLDRLGLVHALRLQVLEALPGGRTRYFTEERFTGALAFAVPLAKVQEGFERHAGALRMRAEGFAGSRGGGA